MAGSIVCADREKRCVLCLHVRFGLSLYSARNHALLSAYELSVPELFLDIYIVCVLLTLIPRKIRIFVRSLLYVILYGVAIADMYCYERFESTLTPTMLMLVGETTPQEAGEFLTGYLSWDIVSSLVGWVLLLILVHVLWTFMRWWLRKQTQKMVLPQINPMVVTCLKAILSLVVACLLFVCIFLTKDNKVAMHRMFSYDTIGQVERELTRKDQANFYVPVYRLAFSAFANHLASHQLVQLKAASGKIQIDSCSYRVPNIVLVIGESYNKHHSQLYGYEKPTTPFQKALAEEGSLVPFTDVVAPWNLTSFVFKHVLSLHAVGDSGEWCDAPLFPEVFRKAGYHVTFITNQFQSQAKEAVYDFSGGFFLNDPEMSQRQFDTRNTSLYRFDDGVLTAYDRLKTKDVHNLVILHLMGSHVEYRARYPQPARRFFTPQNANRPELTKKQRYILSDYDNSVRFNDSIVCAVTQRFIDKDALVIYMPDHGEEIFDGSPFMYGRMHGANIDYRLARNEMEIYGWQAIQNAKDRPMMTDVLPHLLLYLAGISTPAYRPEYNVIAPEYNTRRPRILKGITDYNQLKKK